ncbi:MAG: hypothetical protein U1F54_21910 [Burkholderiales bacterium]
MATRIAHGWRLVLASALLAATAGAHAAGTLDATFVNGERANLVALRYPALAVSADGRIALSATQWSGSFGQFRTAEVALFDGAGQLQQVFGEEGITKFFGQSADAVAFDSLGRVLLAGARLSGAYGASTARLRADGRASATYANGAPGVVPPSRLGSAFAIALDRNSRIVIGGSTAFAGGGVTAGPLDFRPAIARLDAHGVDDPGFGTGGQVVLDRPGVVRAMALDTRGGIVLAFGSALVPAIETKTLMRLNEDGTPDPQFGSGGETIIADAIVAAGDANGRMLVIAERGDSPPSTRLYRYVDGRLDPSFGTGGEVLLPRQYNALATGPDGAIYAGIAGTVNQTATLRVLRIRNDGAIDTTYGSQGEAVASFPYDAPGIAAPSLAVDAQGRLVVAALRYHGDRGSEIALTTVVLYRFTSDTPAMPSTATAIEYRHAAFDHYFVTADADEITKLDANPGSGWARTGESFAVQAQAKGDGMPVCRFWSGATFAPLSSHFYTPYPGECDAVESGPAWAFEKIAFFLTMPTGAGQGNGTCPSGTVPLYRAYNAMRGGAPNHRYTTRTASLDAMIAQGWIMEGEANTRVFACVPA